MLVNWAGHRIHSKFDLWYKQTGSSLFRSFFYFSFVYSGDGEGKLWIWDWDTTRSPKQLQAHEGVCIGAIWHPIEPSYVFTCGWDGKIKLWD
jgi:WD40 repeat protein